MRVRPVWIRPEAGFASCYSLHPVQVTFWHFSFLFSDLGRQGGCIESFENSLAEPGSLSFLIPSIVPWTHWSPSSDPPSPLLLPLQTAAADCCKYQKELWEVEKFFFHIAVNSRINLVHIRGSCAVSKTHFQKKSHALGRKIFVFLKQVLHQFSPPHPAPLGEKLWSLNSTYLRRMLAVSCSSMFCLLTSNNFFSRCSMISAMSASFCKQHENNRKLFSQIGSCALNSLTTKSGLLKWSPQTRDQGLRKPAAFKTARHIWAGL